MKTLKRNNEFKRVLDSTEKQLKTLENLIHDGWSYYPKKLWKATFERPVVSETVEKRKTSKERKENKMKERGSALSVILLLIINVIIVYFGRIYYPINFQPTTVSFFENYWVLTIGELIVGGIICFCVFVILFIGSELWEDIEWIIDKFKK